MLISTTFGIGETVYIVKDVNNLYEYTIKGMVIDIDAKRMVDIDFVLIDKNGVYLTAKEDELFRLAKYKEI